MSEFAITVNNRRYTIACTAESESRLEQAAQQLDQHVKPLAERYGKVGDDRLLLLAALQIIDDLMSTREKLAEINTLIEKSEELRALTEADEAKAEDANVEAEQDLAPDADLWEEDLAEEVEAEPLDLAEIATLDEETDAIEGVPTEDE